MSLDTTLSHLILIEPLLTGVQQPTVYPQQVLRSTVVQQPRHSPISTSPTSSSRTFSGSSGWATSSESFTDGSDASEEYYNGKENHILTLPPRPVASRQVSNFASILDAQMNRIALHSDQTSAVHQSMDFYTVRGLGVHTSGRRTIRDCTAYKVPLLGRKT
jgi:hypothetical protein